MVSNPHKPFVLAVEDNPELAEMLCDALAKYFYVAIATDVPSALSHLATQHPDVALIDCILPGGPASEIVRKAEEVGTAVVLMSGSPEILEAAAARGRICLQKPFGLTLLYPAIAAALAAKGFEFDRQHKRTSLVEHSWY